MDTSSPHASSRAADRSAASAELQIGEQIRELRRVKGMTLQQVADAAGISTGYLSQIERNRSKLPIGVLKRIADLLGVHMNWFFQPETAGPPEERDVIVRARRRRKMSFTGTGISEELLSPNLNGTLDLWVGERTFRLETGDSFSFKSTVPHRCANPGTAPTRVVWVITPPHY